MQSPDVDQVVGLVRRSADFLRHGGEVTFDRNGEPEMWRQIVSKYFKDNDFDTAYRWVSSHGRLINNAGQLRDSATCSTNKNGYPIAGLSGTSTTIHTLVVYTFIGPPPEVDGVEFTVHHGDNNRRNNKLSNLSWRDWQDQYDNRFTSSGKLMKPAKKVKLVHNKPPPKVSKPKLCYDRYLQERDLTMRELAEDFDIKEQSVAVYLTKEYRAEDAQVLCDKLRISTEALSRTYELKEAIKIWRSSDPENAPDNEMYGSILAESLGPNCLDVKFATGIAGRLYETLVRDKATPPEQRTNS